MKKKYPFRKMQLAISCFFFIGISYAQIIPDGVYLIRNNNLDQVLTLDQTNEADVRISEVDATGNNLFQQWQFTHTGNDIYNIENLGSNALLGVADRWCGQFGNVRALSGQDDGFDLRIVPANATDTFLIEIAYDNECNFDSMNDPIKAFDVQDGNRDAEIQTFDKNPDNVNQQFQIITVDPTLSINNNFVTKNTSKVFYNATTGLQIQNNQNQNIDIYIFDTTGSKVYSYPNMEANNIMTVNLESLSPGMYFVQTATNSNKNSVTKIIVE